MAYPESYGVMESIRSNGEKITPDSANEVELLMLGILYMERVRFNGKVIDAFRRAVLRLIDQRDGRDARREADGRTS